MEKKSISLEASSRLEKPEEGNDLSSEQKNKKVACKEGYFDFSKRSEILEEIRKNSPTYVGNFERAYSGRSRAAAMKAHCLMCTCYQRVEVKLCPNTQCPLWEYRPYQRKEVAQEPIQVE